MVAHLACASGALAQAPVRQIRQRMSDNLNATPDFICSVSIERTERMGKGAPATLPALHVDAGIIDGKELYASPSADADQALLKTVLALYGRAGTGSFAMYARAVFLTPMRPSMELRTNGRTADGCHGWISRCLAKTAITLCSGKGSQ
jgi:hypothetical protein